MKLFKFALMTAVLVLTTACGDNGKKSSTTNNQSYSGYCYSPTGIIQGASCYVSNGVCYQRSTYNANYQNQYGADLRVDMSYCGNGSGGMTGQQCVGWYWWSNGNRWVYCNGYDCRGFLLNNQNGQPVQCQ